MRAQISTFVSDSFDSGSKAIKLLNVNLKSAVVMSQEMHLDIKYSAVQNIMAKYKLTEAKAIALLESV